MSQQQELFIKEAVNKLSNDYKKSLFQPLLEDDVLCYFYHLFLNYVEIPRIHVKTRIAEAGNEKFDLVIGNIVRVGNKTAKRDFIDPELIIEFKMFSKSFTNSQNVKRLNYVYEDIEKLKRVKGKANKKLLLFDEVGFLKNKIDNLLQESGKLEIIYLNLEKIVRKKIING